MSGGCPYRRCAILGECHFDDVYHNIIDLYLEKMNRDLFETSEAPIYQNQYIEIIIIIVLREYFWDNDSVLFFKSQKEIIYHMKR